VQSKYLEKCSISQIFLQQLCYLHSYTEARYFIFSFICIFILCFYFCIFLMFLCCPFSWPFGCWIKLLNYFTDPWHRPTNLPDQKWPYQKNYYLHSIQPRFDFHLEKRFLSHIWKGIKVMV